MISPYKMWVNGVALGTVGGVLMTLPKSPYPEKRIKTYKIPGRNGVVTRWLGDYYPIRRTIEVGCYLEDLERVKNFLDNATNVRFSDEPSLVFHGHRIGGMETSALNDIERLISVSFEFQPEKEVLSNALENPGNAKSYPRIKVSGDGILNVSGQEIEVTGNSGELVLDSWLGQVSLNEMNAWPRISVNRLPVVEGDLVVTGTATVVEIKPQWRRL